MSTQSDKIRTVAVSIGLSLLVHLLVLFSLGRFGNYDFTAPVNPLQTVMIDLTKTADVAAPAADSTIRNSGTSGKSAEEVADDGQHDPVQVREASPPPALAEKEPVKPANVEAAVISEEKTASTPRTAEPHPAPQAPAPLHVALADASPPPLRTAGEFISTTREKLSYLVTLLGVPVGNIELEAKNDNGEVRITLRTRSNAALSSIYPVDDLMETRHVVGNFIITKIRQQEGTFKSDIGFTIFLRDKRVFWVDRIRNRYSDESIPNSDVLDTLSSFYYLRNRPLQIGTTETLHIYDGDVYAPVPVEILRQEEIRLRNLKKVDSLLVRHVKQEGGIFRRTGDMLIWLTNDGNRVPLKMETTTPVGKVTVELVSAESQHPDSPGAQNSSR